MNSTTKVEFKKGVMNYVDLVFAIFHFIIIVFPLVVIQNILILEIIGILCSSFLLFQMIYNFTSDNPFYISYGIALLISNFFFLIPSVILIPLIGFFLIPEIMYIYIVTFKSRVFSATKFYQDFTYRKKLGTLGLLPTPNPNLELREKKQSEKAEQRYNAKKHAIISFILLICLVVVFVTWLDVSLI
jgi:hypothetical protein